MSELDQLLKDCAPFLRSHINKGLDLKRHTLHRVIQNSVGQLKKRGPRRRSRIHGFPLLHAWYASLDMKLKDRSTNVFPSTAFDRSPEMSNSKKEYVVLPIGNSYRLVYFKGVRDFNYNGLTARYGVNHPMFPDMFIPDVNDNKKSEAINDFSNKIIEYSDRMAQDNDGDSLRDYLGRILDLFEEYQIIEDELKEFYKFVLKSGECMKNLKRKEKVSMIVNKDMYEAEVAVYAPQGIYYIELGYYMRLIEKIEDKL